MDAREQRILQSFRRVQGWFAAHPEVTPSGGSDGGNPTVLASQLEAFNGVVTRLTDHAADQSVQAVQSTLIAKDDKALRRDVRTHLRRITKVAQALRGTVPGIGSLRMPPYPLTSESLGRAAQSLAKQAAIYEGTLVDHGLPADFLVQVDASVAKVRESIDARGEARSRRAGATRGVREELTLGRRIVAIMDAQLEHILAHDPVALSEWQHAKRVTVRRFVNRPGQVDVAPVAQAETKVA